jgi:hypothetical protein
MRDTIRSDARAAAVRFGCCRLRIFAFVIVIFIDIHVTGSRFVMFWAFLLRCFRHSRQRWRSAHRRKRGRVMSCLGRMVSIIEASGIRRGLRAATRHLWRWHWMCWRWAARLRLLKLLSLLIV